MEYFKRTINEGSVKATHICSFDPTIKLTKLAQRGTKVIDSVIAGSAKAGEDTETTIKEELRNRLASIRINGLPIVLEDLGECFDDDEVIEVIAFVNGADMSKFGGAKKTQDEINEESKNA